MQTVTPISIPISLRLATPRTPSDGGLFIAQHPTMVAAAPGAPYRAGAR